MSSLLEPVMYSWEIGCPDRIFILSETLLLSDYFLLDLRCWNAKIRPIGLILNKCIKHHSVPDGASGASCYKYNILKEMRLTQHQCTGRRTTSLAKKKLHNLSKTASLTCLLLVHFYMYRTRAIITRSRFETALDYKQRIFKVRKVSLHYKPLCNINRGL